MKDADSTRETGGTSEIPIESEVPAFELIQTLRDACEDAEDTDASAEYRRAAFHTTVAPLLPDLLNEYEAALDALQAQDSHCQSLFRALTRAEQALDALDEDKADQAAYAAAYWRADALARVLRDVFASAPIQAKVKEHNLNVSVGDNGRGLAPNVQVSHRNQDGVAYVFYVLEPGRGFRMDVEGSDDTPSAVAALVHCHALAKAIIKHRLVLPHLLDKDGELHIGSPSGNVLLHPKPGTKPRKQHP